MVNSHICSICAAKVFNLGNHMVNHIGGIKIMCPMCFSSISNERKPMRNHTGENPHACTVCVSIYPNVGIHMINHIGINQMICNAYSFKTLFLGKQYENLLLDSHYRYNNQFILSLLFNWFLNYFIILFIQGLLFACTIKCCLMVTIYEYRSVNFSNQDRR